MSEFKVRADCEHKDEYEKCKQNCHCPLKMSFITNICLIALIAVIVITFQLLVVYETSEFETTYETVTVEEY